MLARALARRSFLRPAACSWRTLYTGSGEDSAKKAVVQGGGGGAGASAVDDAAARSDALVVTAAGAVSNVTLSAGKFYVGVLCGSAALIADAIHSVADLVGDGMTMLAVHAARRPPDANHPYGHGKVTRAA
jgi:hypothetical protein